MLRVFIGREQLCRVVPLDDDDTAADVAAAVARKVFPDADVSHYRLAFVVEPTPAKVLNAGALRFVGHPPTCVVLRPSDKPAEARKALEGGHPWPPASATRAGAGDADAAGTAGAILDAGRTASRATVVSLGGHHAAPDLRACFATPSVLAELLEQWEARGMSPLAVAPACTNSQLRALVERRALHLEELQLLQKPAKTWVTVSCAVTDEGVWYADAADPYARLRIIAFDESTTCYSVGDKEFEVYSGDMVNSFKAPSSTAKTAMIETICRRDAMLSCNHMMAMAEEVMSAVAVREARADEQLLQVPLSLEATLCCAAMREVYAAYAHERRSDEDLRFWLHAVVFELTHPARSPWSGNGENAAGSPGASAAAGTASRVSRSVSHSGVAPSLAGGAAGSAAALLQRDLVLAQRQASCIFDAFVEEDADHAVACSSSERDAIRAQLENPPPTLFRRLVSLLLREMQHGVYSRFRETPKFKQARNNVCRLVAAWQKWMQQRTLHHARDTAGRSTTSRGGSRTPGSHNADLDWGPVDLAVLLAQIDRRARRGPVPWLRTGWRAMWIGSPDAYKRAARQGARAASVATRPSAGAASSAASRARGMSRTPSMFDVSPLELQRSNETWDARDTAAAAILAERELRYGVNWAVECRVQFMPPPAPTSAAAMLAVEADAVPDGPAGLARITGSLGYRRPSSPPPPESDAASASSSASSASEAGAGGFDVVSRLRDERVTLLAQVGVRSAPYTAPDVSLVLDHVDKGTTRGAYFTVPKPDGDIRPSILAPALGVDHDEGESAMDDDISAAIAAVERDEVRVPAGAEGAKGDGGDTGGDDRLATVAEDAGDGGGGRDATRASSGASAVGTGSPSRSSLRSSTRSPAGAGAVSRKRMESFGIMTSPVFMEGWLRRRMLRPGERMAAVADADASRGGPYAALHDMASAMALRDGRGGGSAFATGDDQWRRLYFRLHRNGELRWTPDDSADGVVGALAIDLVDAERIGFVADAELPPHAIEVLTARHVWILVPEKAATAESWVSAFQKLWSSGGGGDRARKLGSGARAGAGGGKGDAGGGGGGGRGGHDDDDIVLAGFLQKRGRLNRTWRRRLFRLTRNGVLTYYKKDADSTEPTDDERKMGDLRLNGHVLSVIASDYSEADGGYPVDLQLAERTYSLLADTEADARRWVIELKRFMQSRALLAQRSFKLADAARAFSFRGLFSDGK